MSLDERLNSDPESGPKSGPMKRTSLKRISVSEYVHMQSDYNENSAAQAQGAGVLAGWLGKYASEWNAKLPNDVALHVCEYGCATGGSTPAPLAAIKEACNAGGKRELVATMNDLPMNDWAVLRNTVEKAMPDYTFDYVPRNMYKEPVTAEGSLHLAYSSYAQHWLSDGSPGPLSGGAMWANQLPVDNTQRQVWAQSSRRDWERFLELRAVEMAPGGVAVILIESAQINGLIAPGFAHTMKLAKEKLLQQGVLTTAEGEKMTVPEYQKSPTELLAILTSPDNLQRWKVEEMHYFVAPCPYQAKFQKGEISAQQVIDLSLGFVRAFMNPSIVGAVGEEKSEALWTCAREIAGDDTKAFESDFTNTVMALRRS